MKQYIIPFAIYLFSPIILSFFFQDTYLIYLIKIVLVLPLLMYFWKDYGIEKKVSLMSVFLALPVFFFWVILDGYYPLLSFQASHGAPPGFGWLLIRFLGSITVAPLIEELFVRDFFHRFLINPKWYRVMRGTFSWNAFIITVILFGFSHDRWLGGIIAGIIFNIVYYRSSRISDCILTHGLANLLLGIYVIILGSWQFW